MSLRLDRLWLMLGLFIAGETFALGLGDIQLNSALNEPLRAEIQLVSASAEELAGLKVELASSETFERYGLYRPHFLTRLEFDVERSGGADGNVIQISSEDPITEPFVTFLVEATWPSGRMLREYTVLLDPPTFAPAPTAQSSQAVTAPSRAAPADSGRIERSSPAAAQPATRTSTQSTGTAPFDGAAGGEVRVERGDTLWGIAQRVRPDNRLSINQTMVAIYEANPQAFAGNINRLEAGSTLSIPSADNIFRITRGEAMTEVQRQNSAFGLVDGSGRAEPRLTLVPPDSEQVDYRGGATGAGDEASGAATDARIRELEETIAEQQSLIEVRDNELAQLREELTRIREEAALAGDPGTPDVAAEDEPTDAAEETDRVFADDTAVAGADDDTAADDQAEAEEAAPAPATTAKRAPTTADEPGLLDGILGALTGFWGILGIVLLLVLGILVWLAKRAAGRGEEESTGVWDALDAGDDDVDSETHTSTERLRALAQDDDSSIVVVEQETSPDQRARVREPLAAAAVAHDMDDDVESTADTGVQPALEDTFSSESAINLDQSDPIAEADFHMAYGLYDQAADLINGALAVEPERQELMAKLCEVYFVWGNRDAFVDAASRLHDQLGGESSPDWDKIVIMGQQIAGDHKLFSGVSTIAATRAVDLSFDSDDEAGALDMDFAAGGPDGEVSNVVDLGADDGATDRSGLDFMFDDELDTGSSTTRDMAGGDSDDATVESPTMESQAANGADESPTMESPTMESQAADSTVESPTIESQAADNTIESPTVEQSFDKLDSTSELPAMSSMDNEPPLESGEATAEIDLDDLGLDLHDLAAAGLDDDSAADFSELEESTETGLLGANDDLDATGRNPGFEDEDDLESSPTGIHEGFDLETLAATAEVPAADEATGKNPAVRAEDEHSDTDVDLDASLLDATGLTQVLKDDAGVATAGESAGNSIGDDDKTQLAPAFGDDDVETMLASLDDEYAATAALSKEEVDFDFAKTEALPKDAFSRDSSSDETGEMPSLSGATDVDLDLDDLSAALRMSEGDTVDQPRDEATVERPRVQGNGLVDLDLGELEDGEDDAPTEALSPEEFNDDLHEARTMTEVGTKLDLARAYVDMGDPDGARSILGEVLEEGDDGQRQQAQNLIDTLPA